MGGTATDQGESIDKDASGNIYAVGTFSGTANFGVNFTSAGTTNGFLCKIDPSGNYIWSKHLAGNNTVRINDVKIDATGNIYMTGAFNAGADFDMGVGTASLVSANLSTFILKLDPAGNYLWAKHFAILPPGGTNNGNAIDCDASGNIYITGEFTGITDFNPGAATYSLTPNGSSTDIYIAKLDASGNFLWARQFGGPSGDLVNSMYLDASANIYTTGSFQGTADFDPGAGATIFTANNTDIFISKLNTNGAFVYARQIGGSGIDRGGFVCSDASDNVYATGLFASSVDFDPGAGSYSLTAGSSDIYILKLDAGGNFAWANKFGAGGGAKIVLNAANDLFISGYFTGTSDFNPGAGTYNLTSNGGNDVFISRLDNNGNFVSALSVGGTGSDNGADLYLESSGELYVFGSYSTTMDANPFAGVFNTTSFGNRDPFLLKLTDCSAPAAPVNTTALPNQTICNGTSAVLTATGSGTINWYATPGSTVILASGSGYTTSILSAGTYTYYAAALTCTTSTSQTAITVTVTPSPTVSVNSGVICAGNAFTLVPGGASTYTFSGGTAVVSPTANTSYSVTGASSQGCLSANTAVAAVTVNALPLVSASTTQTLLCTGQAATLTASGAVTYTWSTSQNAVNIIVSPTVSTAYTLSGTDANGCTNSAVITQSVSSCTGMTDLSTDFVQSIYPNPNTGWFIVSTSTTCDVEVRDVLGTVVANYPDCSGHQCIDIRKFANGVYYVKLKAGNQMRLIKVVKY